MVRILAFIFAVAFGGAASQLPEFAQQYRQRLAGTIDELSRVVTGFDADALAEGLSREQAFERYRQTNDAFLGRRADSMADLIARLTRLREQQADLGGAPFVRVMPVLSRMDSDVARKTLTDFEPALPVTTEGIGFGGLGLIFGRILASLLGLSARRKPIRSR